MLKMFVGKKRGFTLVELMVVVIVIGILVAIAIPVYRNVQTRAAENTHNANRRILQGAAAQCVTTEGVPSGTITWNGAASGGDTHKWENYIESWPKNPLHAGHSQAGAYTVTIAQTTGAISVTPAEAP